MSEDKPIDPGPGYRLLEPGELPQEGDEVRTDRQCEWLKSVNWRHGIGQQPGKVYRRKVPLQLREGAWYRRRDQKIVGPVRYRPGTWKQTWIIYDGIDGETYGDDGMWNMQKYETQYDLIAEVPPPDIRAEVATSVLNKLFGPEVPPPAEPVIKQPLNTEPELKPGDWVVSLQSLLGSVYKLTDVGESVVYWTDSFGNGVCVEKQFVRRATPAEIAAYKQAQEPQPDDDDNWMAIGCIDYAGRFRATNKPEVKGADGWIPWSGGECPVDYGAIVEVKFGDGDTEIGGAGRWKECWAPSEAADDYEDTIVAYRLADRMTVLERTLQQVHKLLVGAESVGVTVWTDKGQKLSDVVGRVLSEQ